MTKARRVAVTTAVAAAVLTIIGSALPLFSVTFLTGPGEIEFSMTAWSLETDEETFGSGGVPANGYPLVFAAVILVLAARASWAAARPGARPRTERVAATAFVAGAAFLACAVWLVAAQVVNWEDTYGLPDETNSYSFGGLTSFGAGLWVLVPAALLGVAAAVFAQLPGQVPAPVAEVDPDVPTPPFGIAIPVEPPPPVPEPEPEPQIPVLGPIVIPEAPPPPAPAGPAVPLVEDPLDEPRRD